MNPFYRTQDMMTFSGVHVGKPFLLGSLIFNMAAPIEEERMALLTLSLVSGALAAGLSEWLCERVA